MSCNIDPIYSKAPDWGLAGAVIGPSANTAQDGTGANMYQIIQLDATNGGFVQSVTLKPVGSPAATVARIFICNNVSGAFTGGTTNDGTNTSLVKEFTLPAITLSQTVATPDIEIPINKAYPAGYRVLIAFGTSTGSAGTGYAASASAGKY